jgi:hypothetical protein
MFSSKEEESCLLPQWKKGLNYLLSMEKGTKLPWGAIFSKEQLCEYLTRKYKG